MPKGARRQNVEKPGQLNKNTFVFACRLIWQLPGYSEWFPHWSLSDMRHDPVGLSTISQPHVHPPSSTTAWASFWSGFILFSLELWRDFCLPTPSLFRTRVAVLCKSVTSFPSCHGAKPHHRPHTTPLPLTNVSSWNSDPSGQQLCCKGPLKAFGCAPVGFQSMEYVFISWLGVLKSSIAMCHYILDPFSSLLCNTESLEAKILGKSRTPVT